MPMAIMRNAHEVLRGAMRDIQKLLEKGDLEGAASLWRKFQRFQELHKRMEEGCRDEIDPNMKQGYGVLFRMMDDHVGGVTTEAKLLNNHEELENAEKELDRVFGNSKDSESIKKMFAAFMEDNEAHLLAEEKVLMPSVQKMMKNGVKVKKHLKVEVLSVLLREKGDIEFFLRFGNEILQRHDNIPDQPRVRVFNHAFWAVATPEQWRQWNQWIKESLPPAKYEEVHAAASWC